MANKRKNLYLAFRNGINKLTGKQALIDEYNHAVEGLIEKSYSLRDKSKRADLLKQLSQVMEEQWIIQTSDNGVAVEDFNPYLIKTSKRKIKSKLDMLNQLMKEYNVK